jgi:hypothetical protein
VSIRLRDARLTKEDHVALVAGDEQIRGDIWRFAMKRMSAISWPSGVRPCSQKLEACDVRRSSFTVTKHRYSGFSQPRQ